MIITATRPMRGHRVALVCDGGEDLLIDKTVWEESPFGVGSSLSHEEAEALCAASQRRRAESKAVYLLSKRDLSRRELEQKLCREKGRYCPDNREAAAAAAARMEELGYVDDRAYAFRLAEQMATGKLYPRRRITDELIRKGIDRELAREAAEALEMDETEMALAFLTKKRYTVSQSSEEARRAAAALARYGYGSDVIRRAVRMQGEDLFDE